MLKVPYKTDSDKEIVALRDRVHYLENIIWQLPEQFYWLDLDGRVIACNANQPILFKMTPDEFIGKNVFDVGNHLGWSIDAAQNIRKNDLQVMATHQQVINEEQVFRDNETKTFLSYKNPLYDTNNNVIGVFGMSIDITDRKKIEKDLIAQKQKAENANRAKSNFIKNVSHDIRTPFSGIIGNADILLHNEQDEKKRELLQEIIDSGHYLLDLLNDIINIADRDETMPSTLPLHAFTIAESVQTIVNLMKPQALQKHLYLNVNIDKNVPQKLISNRKSIERILLNLIGNAIKFTETGGITVSLHCLQQDNHRARLQIGIEDTGKGIEAAQVDYLLDKIQTPTTTYTENYQRGGLGLPIVKGLVAELGGKLAITSTQAQGTTFSITFECERE